MDLENQRRVKELAEKYEVITFNNLLDAIDMVRESDFDLILLDNANNKLWDGNSP